MGERLRRPRRRQVSFWACPRPRAHDAAAWVPAILAVNLQITTFFFVAGLMLLERDEGTLTALAVSPFSPAAYLATRTITLTALAAVETIAVVWIAFGAGGSWLLDPLRDRGARRDLHRLRRGRRGALRLGERDAAPGIGLRRRCCCCPSCRISVSCRARRFWLHPIEPALALIRAGYGAVGCRRARLRRRRLGGLERGGVRVGTESCGRLMRDTRAGGGR